MLGNTRQLDLQPNSFIGHPVHTFTFSIIIFSSIYLLNTSFKKNDCPKIHVLMHFRRMYQCIHPCISQGSTKTAMSWSSTPQVKTQIPSAVQNRWNKGELLGVKTPNAMTSNISKSKYNLPTGFAISSLETSPKKLEKPWITKGF